MRNLLVPVLQHEVYRAALRWKFRRVRYIGNWCVHWLWFLEAAFEVVKVRRMQFQRCAFWRHPNVKVVELRGAPRRLAHVALVRKIENYVGVVILTCVVVHSCRLVVIAP